MSKSPSNPRQLLLFSADYQELFDNETCLKAIAEFVAKYRLFTLQEPSGTPFSTMIYDDLYKIHILPLIAEIKAKHTLSKTVAAKIDCLKKILKKMIADSAHNDSWAASLIVEAYRTPFSWRQLPYRNLLEELPIHNTKNISTPIKNEKDGKKITASSITSDHLKHIQKREDYLNHHMPDDFQRYTRVKRTLPIICLVASACMSHEIAKSADLASYNYYIPYLAFFPIAISTLLGQGIAITAANAALPSHLAFDGLPNHMGEGLLNEIRSHIQQQIDSYTAQLPVRSPRPDDPPRHRTRAPSSLTVPGALSVTALSTTSSTALPERFEDKGPKKKTRSSFPLLAYSSLNATPIYRWQTKNFGEVIFQPGRVSDAIPLWSADKKLDNRHVVLFPRKTLEKTDTPMITAFWQTASFGRIARHQDQPGFIQISDQEKTAKDYKLPQNAKFKIKTFHDEYARYRQPVVPCEVEGTDENGIELLVAQQPVKTH